MDLLGWIAVGILYYFLAKWIIEEFLLTVGI